jgi:hypothetical protein
MSRLPNDLEELEDQVQIRLVRLTAKFSGVVIGLFAAAAIFAATNWLVLKGGRNVGAHLSLLGQFFIGYRVTFVGSLIGAAYGFVLGFVCGYVGALIYNWMTSFRDAQGRQPPKP